MGYTPRQQQRMPRSVLEEDLTRLAAALGLAPAPVDPDDWIEQVELQD